MRTFAAHLVRGFTLVEVAMAMGVVSFSVLTMVGLSSVSMATLSESRKEAVGQRITQAVVSRLNTESFSELPTSLAREYFDSEGLRVGDAEHSKAVYVANIEPGGTASFGETSLPADAASQLEIAVHRAPGGVELEGVANRIFHMFVVVPNREKSTP